MIENTGQVKIVEEVGMLCHTLGIVLGDEFEVLYEFATVHDLHFPLDRTDDILELVVDQQSAITIFCVLDHLVGNRTS